VMIWFYRQPSEVARHPFSEKATTPGRPTRSFAPLKPRDPVIDPVINPVTTADTALEEPPALVATPYVHTRPKRRGGHPGQSERMASGGAKRDANPTETVAAVAVESRGPIAAQSSAASSAPSSGPSRPEHGPSAVLSRSGPGLTPSGPPPGSSPVGSVDPRAVTATVRAHAGEVRACFDRALMEHAELHGRLVVHAVLDASGNVVSASATRTMDGGARLETCVLSAFQGWSFPPPANGARAPITYAFSFE
jgi:hypothetical protein